MLGDVGGGDTAISNSPRSESKRGDGGIDDRGIDDARDDEVDAESKLDRGFLAGWGVNELVAIRYQLAFSPDGLFWMVGRTSSRLVYAFVHFSALQLV